MHDPLVLRRRFLVSVFHSQDQEKIPVVLLAGCWVVGTTVVVSLSEKSAPVSGIASYTQVVIPVTKASIPLQPGKQETFTRCWLNVVLSSQTTGQHWNNIGSMSSVCGNTRAANNPVNTIPWNNAGLILAHRLRLWPNIRPTLLQRLVFFCKHETFDHAGLRLAHHLRCWANLKAKLVQCLVFDGMPFQCGSRLKTVDWSALKQHWDNVSRLMWLLLIQSFT